MAVPHIQFIELAQFPRPRGYSNGALVTGGRILYVAGQIGWQADETFASDDLVDQFAVALENLLAVVQAAGGQASDIVEMTIYVTDMEAYRQGARAIGAAWRERLGKHFPAMALVAVAGLVHPRAKVEIQAVAALAPEASPEATPEATGDATGEEGGAP